MIVKVVLDTNFLMIPHQFGVDIFTELKNVMPYVYELIVFDKTIDELQAIKKRSNGKNSV